MKKFKLIIITLGILFIWNNLSANVSMAITTRIDDIDNLNKRKVIQKSLSHELRKGLKGSESKILINASVKTVWSIVDRIENYPKFISQIKTAKVIEGNNNLQKIDTSIKISKFLPVYNYIFIFDKSETYRRIKFRKIDGAFKELFGYFEITPYQGKTILAYRIYSDPGFQIPEFMYKGMSKDAVKIMEAIRAEAEN